MEIFFLLAILFIVKVSIGITLLAAGMIVEFAGYLAILALVIHLVF